MLSSGEQSKHTLETAVHAGGYWIAFAVFDTISISYTNKLINNVSHRMYSDVYMHALDTITDFLTARVKTKI